MNKFKFLYSTLVALLVLMSSCRDFVDPNIPYSDFDNGTYLRTIDRTSVTFNFFDIPSSSFALTLEAVDNQGGNTVDRVEIRVRHLRIVPGVGLVFTPSNDVVVRTLSASDFSSVSDSRFLRTSFNIPAAEALSAVGLTEADLEGGDFFDFRLVLTTTSGRVFSDDNRSADVAGGFFYQSPFFYRVGVVCPSNVSTANDTWAASTVSNFGNFSATVTVTPLGEVQYIVSDISAGLYAGFGFNTTQEGVYEDACGTFNWVRAGTTQFSLANPGATGSWNPATQTLTLPWADSGNGIQGVTTLVKQ